MKTIRQLAVELQISKEAVYKKIKYQLKDELDGHVTMLNGITQIDEFGKRILFESLSLERQQAVQASMEPDGQLGVLVEPVNWPDVAVQPYHVEFIRLLKEQLRLKDQQINVQNEHIAQLITQTGYGQMLLKTSLYKSTLLLKTPVMRVRAHHKPFWRRFFKKK